MSRFINFSSYKSFRVYISICLSIALMAWSQKPGIHLQLKRRINGYSYAGKDVKDLIHVFMFSLTAPAGSHYARICRNCILYLYFEMVHSSCISDPDFQVSSEKSCCSDLKLLFGFEGTCETSEHYPLEIGVSYQY